MRWILALPVLSLAPPLHAAPALCPEAAAAIEKAAAHTLAEGTPGLIVEVAQHGHPLFVGTYGKENLEQGTPVTPASVFKYASITKQFTAALVVGLAREGKIGLDRSVVKYLPDLPNAKGITVRDLLQQTSGIPDYAGIDEMTYPPSVGLTPAQMFARISRLIAKPDFAPGARWAYSNSNYALLGMIAEKVTGEPLADLFAKRLLGPAGAQSIAFDDPGDVVSNRAAGYRKVRTAPSGFENADWIHPTIPGPAGGLRGTAHDLVRWHQALFHGRVLDSAGLAIFSAPGHLRDGRTTKFGMPIEWQKGLDSDYAMGLFVKATDGGTRLGHGGDINGFSTWAAYYPGSDVTIVQLINSESVNQPTDAIEAAVFAGDDGNPCLAKSG